MDSITEVVQTVNDPKSHIRATSHDTTSKLEEQEKTNFGFALPKSVEIESTSSQSRPTTSIDLQGSVSRWSSSHDRGKNSRKSARISLMGYLYLLFFYLNWHYRFLNYVFIRFINCISH